MYILLFVVFLEGNAFKRSSLPLMNLGLGAWRAVCFESCSLGGVVSETWNASEQVLGCEVRGRVGVTEAVAVYSVIC